jgi:hypothetical protein
MSALRGKAGIEMSVSDPKRTFAAAAFRSGKLVKEETDASAWAASATGGHLKRDYVGQLGHRPLIAQEGDMSDQEIRAALDRHWAASDANDFEAEHSIYREDAVLEYPQSGERIRGRRNIQITRAKQPSKKRFAVRRIIGSGDLWVTEYILTYDGKPSYTVSIMEFSGGKVARETQYFADPFEASAWRAQWVERMDT